MIQDQTGEREELDNHWEFHLFLYRVLKYLSHRLWKLFQDEQKLQNTKHAGAPDISPGVGSLEANMLPVAANLSHSLHLSRQALVNFIENPMVHVIPYTRLFKLRYLLGVVAEKLHFGNSEDHIFLVDQIRTFQEWFGYQARK